MIIIKIKTIRQSKSKIANYYNSSFKSIFLKDSFETVTLYKVLLLLMVCYISLLYNNY